MSDLPQDPFSIAIAAGTPTDPSGKAWWQSRSIWGVVIILAAQIGALAGVQVDQAATLEAVMGLVTIFGALLAWVGRVKADQPISLRKIAPGVTLAEKSQQP